VLAVDPSSTRTGGSILGDKTRMAVTPPIAGCRRVSTLSESHGPRNQGVATFFNL
jgi:putative protein kinase ArgK-like GTPase of G3E family